MEVTREQVIKVLKGVNYPGFSRDIVSFGLVKDVEVDGSAATVTLVLPKPDADLQAAVEQEVKKAVFGIRGIEDLSIKIGSRPAKQIDTGTGGAGGEKGKLPDVKHYIAVASGKGGVGKSTIATNLALAVSRKREKVGLLDADIWGPSAPIMMGIREKPLANDEDKIVPIRKFGLKVMSIGFLVNEQDAVIWRGPMVHGAIKQFIEDVDWSGTDYLIIDLPPGTGDAQLSLAQTAPVSGGVIVTTPQDVALIDVRRGILMFNKLNIPIVGIVENMSYLETPGAGAEIDIFGRGGGRRMAEKFEVPFLGEIPLDPRIRIGGDTGAPIVESDPQSAASRAFFEIADRILESVEN